MKMLIRLAFLCRRTGHTKKSTPGIDFSRVFFNCGIDANYFICGVNGTFYVACHDAEYHDCILRFDEYESNGETIDITIGTYLTDISEYVIAFNSSQSSYRLVIKDYSEYDDYDSDNVSDYWKGQQVLAEDIAASNSSDIIVGYLDFATLAEQGAIADLFQFMESDSSYTKDSFLDGYLEATEIDGALYWLTPLVYYETLTANAELVSNATSWSIEDYVDILTTCNDAGIEIREYNFQADILNAAIYHFYDGLSKTSYFGDDRFLNLLILSEHIEQSYDAI